jgi:acetyl esterase/lipase
MTTTIWMPSVAIDVMLLHHPHKELRSILWPLAVWLFFVTFIGSHIATGMGYISNKRNATNSTSNAFTAGVTGGVPPVPVAVGTDKRLVPVDLAGILGLLWASVAIAAGPGPINDGPVAVVGYLSAGWQVLSVIVAISESS